MRSLLWMLIVLTVIGVGISHEAQAQTQKREIVLTVALDWFLNPVHVTLVRAVDKGIFERYGLKVNLVTPSNPSDVSKMVASERTTIGIAYQPQLYTAANAKMQVVRFGTLVSMPLVSVMVREDSNITTPAQLQGKKVGYAVAGVQENLLDAIAVYEKIDPKSIERVLLNMALSQGLLTNSVDAVIGAFRNFEPHELRQRGIPVRVFYVEQHGIPMYDELIFITHKKNLESCKNALPLKNFLAALADSYAEVVNDPVAAWNDLIESKKELDTQVNRSAFYDTLPRLASNPAAFDPNRYEDFAKFLLGRKFFSSLPETKTYAGSLPVCS